MGVVSCLPPLGCASTLGNPLGVLSVHRTQRPTLVPMGSEFYLEEAEDAASLDQGGIKQ